MDKQKWKDFVAMLRKEFVNAYPIEITVDPMAVFPRKAVHFILNTALMGTNKEYLSECLYVYSDGEVYIRKPLSIKLNFQYDAGGKGYTTDIFTKLGKFTQEEIVSLLKLLLRRSE